MDSPTSPSFMTCALMLDTQLPGWHKAMIKVLSSVKGVSYTIDAETRTAFVSGSVEPNTLLKMLAKAGKHAVLYRIDSGYNRSNGSHNSYYYPDDYEYYEPSSMAHYYHDVPHQQLYGHPQIQHYSQFDSFPAPAVTTSVRSSEKSADNKSSSNCCMM